MKSRYSILMTIFRSKTVSSYSFVKEKDVSLWVCVFFDFYLGENDIFIGLWVALKNTSCRVKQGLLLQS